MNVFSVVFVRSRKNRRFEDDPIKLNKNSTLVLKKAVMLCCLASEVYVSFVFSVLDWK